MSAHLHTPVVHEHADQWHHHDPSEGRPQSEHAGAVDTGLVARWFVGIIIFVVGLIMIIAAYFISVTSEMRTERIETTLGSKQANAARAEAEATMGFGGNPGAYVWVDPDAGTVQLPISEAMKKVQQKYAAKK